MKTLWLLGIEDSVTTKVTDPFLGSRKILDSHSDVGQTPTESVTTLSRNEKNQIEKQVEIIDQLLCM